MGCAGVCSLAGISLCVWVGSVCVRACVRVRVLVCACVCMRVHSSPFACVRVDLRVMLSALQESWWISERDEAISRSMQVHMPGYRRATLGGTQAVLQGYSGGTQAVLQGYSGGTQAVLQGYSGDTQGVLHPCTNRPSQPRRSLQYLFARVASRGTTPCHPCRRTG